MHDRSGSRLPEGYGLDLVGDPCIVILRDPEGEIVARFARDIDPEEGPSATRSPTMFRTGCSLHGGLLPVAIFGLLLPVLHARCPLLSVQRRLLVRGEK